MQHGFDVATSKLSSPEVSIESDKRDVLNNYGVAAIANELRWALDPAHPFDAETNTIEVAPNRYVDLHIPTLPPAPLRTVRAYRTAITEVTRRVVDCRVVVMTLGLSEVWYDASSGTYLNATPLPTLVTKFPGGSKFIFSVLTKRWRTSTSFSGCSRPIAARIRKFS